MPATTTSRIEFLRSIATIVAPACLSVRTALSTEVVRCITSLPLSCSLTKGDGQEVKSCGAMKASEELACSDGFLLPPYRDPPGQFGDAESFAESISRTNRGSG